jgi:large subunit ribosomal protein L46
MHQQATRRGLAAALAAAAAPRLPAAALGPLCRGRGLASAAAAAAAEASSAKKKASGKAPSGPPPEEGVGYFEAKRAEKERRRALYEGSQERRGRLATRREGRPRNVKRKEFRDWFIAQKVRDEHLVRKARQAGLGWKVQASAVLVRNAVVLPDPEPWEEEMEDLQSYLSQFGKVYPKALFDVDHEADFAVTLPELLERLPEGFTPAPRETEADREGNVRTTDRKLKTDVFLTVQSEPGGPWHFPTAALRENETLLQAAQRALAEAVGPRSNLEYWSLSNAPLSVRMSKFEKEEGGLFGTQTYFLKLYYDEGRVVPESSKDLQGRASAAAHDYAWLDRDEIVERTKQQRQEEEGGEEASKFYRYLL